MKTGFFAKLAAFLASKGISTGAFISMVTVGVVTIASVTTTCVVLSNSQGNKAQSEHTHIEVIDSAVAATCSDTGLTEGKHCSVCGDVLVKQNATSKLEHIYSNDMDTTCNLCGKTRSIACDHTETESIAGKAATCSHEGLTDGKNCKKCGEIIKEQEIIPIDAHTEVIDAAKAPTCVATGLSEGKHCSVCQKVLLIQQDIAPLGHVEMTNAAKVPTCSEAGLTKGIYCAVCNLVLVAQQEISALPHTEAIDAAVAPTCIATGLTEGRHCSVCSKTLVAQTVISTTAHIEVIDAAVAATCTTIGKTEGKHCTVCNAVIIAQKNIAAIGHTEVTYPAVAATCTTDGKTEGKHCSVCNAIIVKQNTITAIGHVYDKGAVVSSASCIQKGTIKYTCTALNCGHSYTESYSLPIYTATEINDQAISYVGEIITYDKNGYEQSLGTAFVFSSDGKIITNYHVIDDAYSAKITINGTAYKIVSVLAYDETIDLAVLKINATGLATANICKNTVKVGETVYAIGSSRGLTNTFSQGIITYADRVVDGVSHIQHDASITNGNSGGPLINQYGEVIGINSWLLTNSQNLNFAVFADELDNLVYGTPKTLAELYEQNHTASETLKEHLLENGTYNSKNNWYEVDISKNFSNSILYFGITYDATEDSMFVSLSSFWDNGDWAYMYLSLNSFSDGTLYYHASYKNKASGATSYTELNDIQGAIDPSTFLTFTTTLPYTSFESFDNDTAGWLEYQSGRMKILLDYLSEYFANENLNITLSDFGFTNYN